MNAEQRRVVDLFNQLCKRNNAYLDKLRKKDRDYDVDEAISVFSRWMCYEDARRVLNESYGLNLPETMVRIYEIISKKKINHSDFRAAFRTLAFVVGPRNIELCASAVTPCGCCSN